MSFALLCSAGLAAAVRAQQFDGRYLGNVFHSETGSQDSDHTSHLYDIIMRQDTPRAWRLDLGASLRYDSRFSYESDLFRGRAFGELASRSWRLHGQLVPWQRMQPTPDLPSRRDLQLGLDLLPARAPHLSLYYSRADRRTQLGESGAEDMRADVSYGRGPLGGRLGVRRLETRALGFEAASRTDEFRAGLLGGTLWKNVAVSGAYDAIITDIAQRERRVDQDIQRAAGDAVWAPHRQVNLSVNGLYRWGATRDNALPRETAIDETSLGARLAYLPVTGLMLNAQRSYYKSAVAEGNAISDYVRLEAFYQHPLVARTRLQTGYSQTLDIASQGGGLPNSAAYITIDGDLRRNLWARAETRAARAPLQDGALQWYFALDLRTRLNRSTTFDVLWNRYSLPEIEGLQQVERTWELKAGYSPLPGTSLIGSYRRLDGEGRLERSESLWSANGSWRWRQNASFALYGSRRRSLLQANAELESILGADLTLEPRDRVQLRGTWKYAERSERPPERSYGVILTRTF